MIAAFQKLSTSGKAISQRAHQKTTQKGLSTYQLYLKLFLIANSMSVICS